MSARDALREQLGAEPPPGLDLPDADLQRLADLVRNARRVQGKELEESLTKALQIVPLPLRGTVRKVVGL